MRLRSGSLKADLIQVRVDKPRKTDFAKSRRRRGLLYLLERSLTLTLRKVAAKHKGAAAMAAMGRNRPKH
jgi:hypothetical protein